MEAFPTVLSARSVREFSQPHLTAMVYPSVQNPDTATSLKPLTDGQVSDLNNGHSGWLYIRAKVLYQGHRTEACFEYPVLAGQPKSSTASEGAAKSATAYSLPRPGFQLR